jgi:hypothetical protein
MKRNWLWVLLVTVCAGCGGVMLPVDWTPLVATEAALITMAGHDSPQAQMEDAEAVGEPVTGPLDTIHDARELIRKGNALADRGQAILDQAERDGKITVDIRLPDPSRQSDTSPPESACSDKCPTPAARTVRSTTSQRTTRRPLLFWRWRR